MAADLISYAVVESFTGSVVPTVAAAVNTRMAALATTSAGSGIPNNQLNNINGGHVISDIRTILTSADALQVTMSITYSKFQ